MPAIVWADAPGREVSEVERSGFLERFGLPEQWACEVGLEVRRDELDGCWYLSLGSELRVERAGA